MFVAPLSLCLSLCRVCLVCSDVFLIPEFVEEHNKKVFHQQMMNTGNSLLFDGEYGVRCDICVQLEFPHVSHALICCTGQLRRCRMCPFPCLLPLLHSLITCCRARQLHKVSTPLPLGQRLCPSGHQRTLSTFTTRSQQQARRQGTTWATIEALQRPMRSAIVKLLLSECAVRQC